MLLHYVKLREPWLCWKMGIVVSASENEESDDEDIPVLMVEKDYNNYRETGENLVTLRALDA